MVGIVDLSMLICSIVFCRLNVQVIGNVSVGMIISLSSRLIFSGVSLVCDSCSWIENFIVSIISGSIVLVSCLRLVLIYVGGCVGISIRVNIRVYNGGKWMICSSICVVVGGWLLLQCVIMYRLKVESSMNVLNWLQIIVYGSVVLFSRVCIIGQLMKLELVSVMQISSIVCMLWVKLNICVVNDISVQVVSISSYGVVISFIRLVLSCRCGMQISIVVGRYMYSMMWLSILVVLFGNVCRCENVMFRLSMVRIRVNVLKVIGVVQLMYLCIQF